MELDTTVHISMVGRVPEQISGVCGLEFQCSAHDVHFPRTAFSLELHMLLYICCSTHHVVYGYREDVVDKNVHDLIIIIVPGKQSGQV